MGSTLNRRNLLLYRKESVNDYQELYSKRGIQNSFIHVLAINVILDPSHLNLAMRTKAFSFSCKQKKRKKIQVISDEVLKHVVLLKKKKKCQNMKNK